jgi:hypothetical protein
VRDPDARRTDVSDQPDDRPEGVLPGGAPDDDAQRSTPGSEGDGPESGYEPPAGDEAGHGADGA